MQPILGKKHAPISGVSSFCRLALQRRLLSIALVTLTSVLLYIFYASPASNRILETLLPNGYFNSLIQGSIFVVTPDGRAANLALVKVIFLPESTAIPIINKKHNESLTQIRNATNYLDYALARAASLKAEIDDTTVAVDDLEIAWKKARDSALSEIFENMRNYGSPEGDSKNREANEHAKLALYNARLKLKERTANLADLSASIKSARNTVAYYNSGFFILKTCQLVRSQQPILTVAFR